MPSEIRLSDSTTEAIAALEGGVEHFLSALAFEIEARAKDNAHVITGAMRESVSAVTPSESHYAANVAAAQALNPKADFAAEATVGPLEAIVQVPAGYSGFEEFGVHNRAAHPFLTPAVEGAVSRAEEIARQVFGL